MRDQAILCFGKFFASAHFFLIIYILAPYLATFMSPESTGLVVCLGAVITLVAFPFMPKLIARHGAQTLAIFFALVEAVLLLWLAIDPAPIAAILFAAFACAVSPFVTYPLDLMLEATMKDEDSTGRVRTAFLTAGNAGLLITPLVTGFLLANTEAYSRIFLAAAVSLAPFVLVMLWKRFPKRTHPQGFRNVAQACICVMSDPDLRAIALAMTMLQFFYYLAPLYVTLYLHTALGISWSELSWIFAVMLIPFVLVEYPAGVLADTRFGDRSLLIAGFMITGLSFGAIAFIHTDSSALLIVAILVVTRIGASLVEAMTEGHFFRRVSEEDTSTVGIFRMARPMGALIAPLVGSILLAVTGYGSLFIITGIIIAAGGIFISLAVRDTALRPLAKKATAAGISSLPA